MLVGVFKREHDVVHGAVQVAYDDESGVFEDAHHARVVAEDISIEECDLVTSCDRSQLFEKTRSNTSALQFVGDGESDVGAGRHVAVSGVAGDRQDSPTRFADQHDIMLRVGTRDARDFGLVMRSQDEEAVIEAFTGEVPMKAAEFLFVIGSCFTDEQR